MSDSNHAPVAQLDRASDFESVGISGDSAVPAAEMPVLDPQSGSVTQHNDRWRLRISVGGVRHSFGTYDTRAEAEAARDEHLARLNAGASAESFRAMRKGTRIIYFVQNPRSGAVKIGRTTDLKRRLAQLRVAIPRLRLLAVIPGYVRLERIIQRAFDEHRFGGEWFEPTSELMELVDELRDIWGTVP